MADRGTIPWTCQSCERAMTQDCFGGKSCKLYICLHCWEMESLKECGTCRLSLHRALFTQGGSKRSVCGLCDVAATTETWRGPKDPAGNDLMLPSHKLNSPEEVNAGKFCNFDWETAKQWGGPPEAANWGGIPGDARGFIFGGYQPCNPADLGEGRLALGLLMQRQAESALESIAFAYLKKNEGVPADFYEKHASFLAAKAADWGISPGAVRSVPNISWTATPPGVVGSASTAWGWGQPAGSSGVGSAPPAPSQGQMPGTAWTAGDAPVTTDMVTYALDPKLVKLAIEIWNPDKGGRKHLP